jgi:hypothetical protein
MGKLSLEGRIGNQHPRQNFAATASFSVAGAELIVDCDGCSSFLLDLRGTFSGTVEVAGCSTIDGATYTIVPVVPVGTNSRSYLLSVVGSAQGLWEGKCAGYTKIRVRCTSFGSGAILVNLTASNGLLDDSLNRATTQLVATTTQAAGVSAVLTLPAVSGLKPYLTFLRIIKFAAANLTAGVTPVVVATSNLPGSLAFSLPADGAAQGTEFVYSEDYAQPIAASAQGANTTIVAPATPNIIWRITAGYYLAQ